MATNFVLGSKKSSTYPRGYASGFVSPAAALDGHFEYPDEPKQNANLTITEISNFEFLILNCEAKA
ncbi:hypothetical protein [Nitrospira sp. Nam74]